MDNYQPNDDDEFMRQQMEAYRAFERQKASPAPSPVPSPVKVVPIETKVADPQGDANLLAQQEALAFYQRKQQHHHEEQQDYLLALKFQQEEEEQQRQAEIDRKRNQAQTDAQLAVKLLQQEKDALKQRQEQAVRDAEIAKRILEEDERKEKQDKEKRDLEATMNLIRDEAKYELQQELDRIKAEKRRLENQLANQAVHAGNPLELSLADCEYPDDWEWQDQPHALFEVRKGTPEWNRIQSQFKLGMQNGNITRIQRNQNRTLWMWYWLKRNEIAQKNNRGPNERLVWHGSRNNAYDTILKEGFDIRVANMGGAIGAGVYFASSSSTSSGYVVGGGGTKKMIYSRVILGEMGQGQQGLRRPPEKRHGVLYDSVGNNTMYVVFDNHQAFPEYVIYYTQR